MQDIDTLKTLNDILSTPDLTNSRLPASMASGDVPEHVDRHSDGELTTGRIAVLYLTSGGHLVFRGNNKRVAAVPGPLVVWPASLRHAFEADAAVDVRAMVGPLALRAGELEAVGWGAYAMSSEKREYEALDKERVRAALFGPGGDITRVQVVHEERTSTQPTSLSDQLAKLEKEVYGNHRSGSILQRIAKLEDDVLGERQQGSLKARVAGIKRGLDLV